MGAGDPAHLLGALHAGKRREVPDVEAVGAPGAGVGLYLNRGLASQVVHDSNAVIAALKS